MQPIAGTLSADYKAPEGKLLRVRLTISTHTTPPVITSFRLTGDFFMHPEDALLDLEDDLVGAPLDATALRERVQAFFDTEVQVVGAAVEDIVHVVMAAGSSA